MPAEFLAVQAAEAAQGRRNLGAVALLGRSTQRVREGSVAVDMSALNAMLSAHRAGAQASGFRTAAAQMRAFSTELSARMEVVSGLVAALSGDVAQQRRQRRAASMIAAAGRDSERAGATLAGLRAAQQLQGERAHSRLQGRKRQLVSQVAQSLRLCGSGRNLARCALIEAAHAGDMAAQLRLVATELGTAVQALTAELETMQLDLQEVLA